MWCNKSWFLSMAVFFGLVSCSSKKEKLVAIDVLLIPSEEIYAQSLRLNEVIHQNNPQTLKLDQNHVPHITLLQCFVKENDLPTIEKNLKGLFQTITADSLKTTKLSYDSSKAESFAMISIEKSQPLLNLHAKAIAVLKPFITKDGSEAAFVQNPDGSAIDPFTVAYVPAFVGEHSFQNFDPHISLGVAPTDVLDSLAVHIFKPKQFLPASLCVYQLGDHGTAQKLLWQAE
jgi:hypothetical protein